MKQNKTGYNSISNNTEWYMSILFDELTVLDMVRQGKPQNAMPFINRAFNVSEIVSQWERKDIKRGEIGVEIANLESKNAEENIKHDAWLRTGGIVECLQRRIEDDIKLLNTKNQDDLGMSTKLRKKYMDVLFCKGEPFLDKLEHYMDLDSFGVLKGKEDAVFKDMLMELGKDSHKRFQLQIARTRSEQGDDVELQSRNDMEKR